MSEQYSVRDARAKFSEILGKAEGGARITITRDGRAVAQLGPAPIEAPTSRADAQARQRRTDEILGKVNRKAKT